jgi:CMP-N,N'-diacetyllegionaminic acid synthase
MTFLKTKSNSNIIAIIPARGGSKGIKNKNIKLIKKIPLFVWSVLAAQKEKIFDKIIVTSNSEKILKIAKKYGAECLKRSKSLSSDKAKTIDVIIDILLKLKKIGKFPEIVVLLEPTSPFRPRGIIRKCLLELKKKKFKSIATCTQVNRTPFNIFKKKNQVYERILKQGKFYSRRQQMKNLKRINGNVYINYSSNIIKDNSVLSEPIGLIEIDEINSINIDSNYDLKIANLFSDRLKL